MGRIQSTTKLENMFRLIILCFIFYNISPPKTGSIRVRVLIVRGILRVRVIVRKWILQRRPGDFSDAPDLEVESCYVLSHVH